MILGGCYALWLFNRIAYGNLKSQYIKETLDINKREFFIFVPLNLLHFNFRSNSRCIFEFYPYECE
jgi:NADH:ubiquinone oxidoreductase subunit 4 (subunit M)